MVHSNGSQQVRATTRLRKLIFESRDIVVAPGVHDGFTARIAHEVGFDCIYMTGAGTCASLLGQPDLGFASQDTMRRHAEMIANLKPSVPLIADADHGYGGPNMVARTIQMYIMSGIAGCHIEDQVSNKRCGHLQGKQVVSIEEFEQRIRAAASARDQADPDFVIIARTDALQTHGYDEAARRLKAAIKAGADVGFLEGVTNEHEARKICKELEPTPVLLNMVENGSTPSWTVEEAQALGFRIIIYPFAALAPSYTAIRDTYLRIKEKGQTDIDRNFTPRTLFQVVGLNHCIEVDQAAGGEFYNKT